MIPIPDVSVLNCGAGDMTFSFDRKNPQECARAERVVKDMLARGYMLFATVRGKLRRVTAFDAATHEYVIADGPEAVPTPPTTDVPHKRGRGRPQRVAASGTPVAGIAPTAGG